MSEARGTSVLCWQIQPESLYPSGRYVPPIIDMETNAKPNALTRRQFLYRSSFAAGSAALAFPYVGQVLGANERLNIACIGVGGKGDSDSSDAKNCGGNIVAICDVDKKTLAKKGQQFA